MASSTDNSKAQWDEEIVALLDYLLDHKSVIGEAGSFKMPTYKAAVSLVFLLMGPRRREKCVRQNGGL